MLKILAVAINEDNHEDSLFTQLKNGDFRICFASPETLLRNPKFKKLFWSEEFRRRIPALVVDECHVLEMWKDEFRKDYDELETLKIIAGSEIPWMALTATSSTETFELVYNALGLGIQRPFWGIDMGADRPNLAQWIRPMEYSVSSMADLMAFIPKSPTGLESFKKTIFYYKTRQLARQGLKLCRSLVPREFRTAMYVYTATGSDEYKTELTDLFKKNKTRWVHATIALGMGLDIPDIEQVVIWGVGNLKDAYQQGGRAGRDRSLAATMIWEIG